MEAPQREFVVGVLSGSGKEPFFLGEIVVDTRRNKTNQCCSLPGRLKKNCQVGNLVLDPRLHMPSKRLVPSVVGAAEDHGVSASQSESVPVDSEIWDSQARARVKEEMLTQDEINKLRQKKSRAWLVIVASNLLHVG